MAMESTLAMMSWSLSPPWAERASMSPETLEEKERLLREFLGDADRQIITKPEIEALFQKLGLAFTQDQLSNWMSEFAVDGGLSMNKLTALMVHLRIARERAVIDAVGPRRISEPERAAPFPNQGEQARIRPSLERLRCADPRAPLPGVGPGRISEPERAAPFPNQGEQAGFMAWLERLRCADPGAPLPGVGPGRISEPELAAPFRNQGKQADVRAWVERERLSCAHPGAPLPGILATFNGFGPGRISEPEMAAPFRNQGKQADGRAWVEYPSFADPGVRAEGISGPELVAPFPNQGQPARLRALLEKLGCADPDEELSRVMAVFSLDADADGRISGADLAALFKNLGIYGNGRMSLPELVPLLEKLSNESTYGDGRMSLPDLAALLEKLVEKLENDVEMGPMMAETDGDGYSSFDESVVDTEAGTSDGSISSDDGDSVVITIDAAPGRSNGRGVVRASAADDDDGEDDRTRNLVWTVGILCAISDSLAPVAAMYTSPRAISNDGSDLAYRVCIASIAVTGVANMLAAVWVSGPQAPFARATARKILYACIFTITLSIALEVVAILLRIICD